jgi:biopolymer transport protein TolR
MALSSNPSSQKQPEPDINVTPLVDVMLVLLIIFMVVTPALNQGDTIQLPEILQVDKHPKDMDPIELTLGTQGSMTLQDSSITLSELKTELVAMHEAQPNRKLMLVADARLPYRRIRETFAVVQGVGFRGVALKTIQKKDS